MCSIQISVRAQIVKQWPSKRDNVRMPIVSKLHKLAEQLDRTRQPREAAFSTTDKLIDEYTMRVPPSSWLLCSR